MLRAFALRIGSWVSSTNLLWGPRRGVLAVPFRTFCLGDDTYYTVFETRARGLI